MDLREMFYDAENASDRGERAAALKSAIDGSVAKAGKGKYFHKNLGWLGAPEADPAKAAARDQLLTLQKSLEPSAAASLQASIDELSKDIDTGQFTNYPGGGQFTPGGPGTGSPGNLRPYDLEAPAKILVPRFTPLRNELPRTKGVGGAREYRRILGYSNANMGGVPDQDIFLDSEFGNVDGSGQAGTYFGGLNLRRGQKISYAMDSHAVPYVEASVSDMVTYKAQFANLGFENSRSLSAMALLWAHMLGEEKALLFGRGSANGYRGASTATGPSAAATGTVTTASGGNITGSATVVFTQRIGVGETLVGTASAAVAPSNGSIVISTAGTNSAVAGLEADAYGVNVYATISSVQYFLGFIPAGEQAASVTFSNLGAVASPPTGTNTTANNGYDGLLTVLLNPAVSGHVGVGADYTIAGTGGTGDAFIQDTCEALYQNVYADPDEVWLNVVQSRALGDYFRSDAGGAQAFRINFSQTGEANVGSVVTGIYNQSSPTRKLLDLRVHPYMPYGCAIVRSRTLDIPDSGIGDTTEVVAVQEYMGIDWPQIQFTYDASTYWMGTVVHYAPAWSGAISGLTT